MEKAEKAISLGRLITQRVFDLARDPNPETTLEVKGVDLRTFYEYNYNPQKGETPAGELHRWLEFIYNAHKIRYAYVYDRDAYLFKHEKPVNNLKVCENCQGDGTKDFSDWFQFCMVCGGKGYVVDNSLKT